MSLNRRGISLLELLVALTLAALLALLTSNLLATSTLHLRDRSERMAQEQSLRSASGALRSALESLGHDSAGGADLSAPAPSGLSARAVRAAGVLCSAAPGLLVARADTAWWRALRAPVAGRDSVLAARLDRPTWGSFELRAAPGGTFCPDGSRGIALPVTADSLALLGIGLGSPIRVFEPVELRLYSAAPDLWIGLRLLATTQAIQPFAGPMAPNGLAFSYQKADRSPAQLPAEVAGVVIQLTSLTERAGGVGLIRGRVPRSDSLELFVALGNPP